MYMQRMYPIGKVLDEANARIHPSDHPSPIVVGATENAKRNGKNVSECGTRSLTN